MRTRGFTLLEVLLAISLLTIITMAVYVSFSSVTRTMAATRVGVEELRLRQFIERSITTNLMSVYTDRGHQNQLYQFIGEDEENRIGPRDSLRLVSAAPSIGGFALPGDLKEVRYEVIGGEDSEFEADLFDDATEYDMMMEQAHLQVVETPLAASNAYEYDFDQDSHRLFEDEDYRGDESDVYEPPMWRVPVHTLDIQYFDGLDWQQAWDSATAGRLPWAVRFRINFARTEEQLEEDERERVDYEEDPDMEVVVLLPGGAGRTMDAMSLEEAEAIADGDIPLDEEEIGNALSQSGMSMQQLREAAEAAGIDVNALIRQMRNR